MTGPDITPGKIDEWPIYLTDDGIVQCHHTDCGGYAIGNGVRGRRVVWLEFVLALQHHALTEHGVALN